MSFKSNVDKPFVEPTREEVARLFRAWQDVEREYGWGSLEEMAARDAHGAASRKCAEHEERKS